MRRLEFIRGDEMQADFYYVPTMPGVTATNNLTDKVLSDNPEVHVVTEPSQNSRDAVRKAFPGKRARIDYTFKTLPYEVFLPYGIETAMAHAEACSERDITHAEFGEDLKVLVVSDHSGGLAGKIDGIHIEPGSPLEIFGFTSGTGVDGKNGHEGGRHGYGSASFAAASDARYMLFYSRRPDGSSVMSGRLSLTTHVLNGKKYAMEARLGYINRDAAPGTEGAWLGILVNEAADKFARDLGIERAVDDPGLTCVIVGRREQVNEATIIEQIVSKEYYQVSEGLIDYGVHNKDTGSSTEITSENLWSFISSQQIEAFRQPQTGKRRRRDGVDRARAGLAFVKACQTASEAIEFDSFDNIAFSEEIGRNYLTGKPTAGILSLTARHVDRETVNGKLRIYVQRTKDGEPGVSIKVRGSIVNTADCAGHNMLVISDGDDIEVLLGDAEDISHTRYEVNQAKARGWIAPKTVIDTFNAAGSRFCRALADTETESDTISLAEFFPMPGNSTAGRTGGGASGEPDSGEVLFENPGGGTFTYEYDFTAKTLRLSFTDEIAKLLRKQPPEDVVFKLEYPGQSKGVGSFTESGAQVTADGCEGHSYRDGLLQVWGATADLEILVVGVDVNRNIDIAIVPETELAEAA
ncbi:hypothetical protein O9X98_15105 [Agrobacterium salinitolerans]|nr:hypothetical protein [Agrobacterium salinitolerans]